MENFKDSYNNKCPVPYSSVVNIGSSAENRQINDHIFYVEKVPRFNQID